MKLKLKNDFEREHVNANVQITDAGVLGASAVFAVAKLDSILAHLTL